jgi:hypothetical protein
VEPELPTDLRRAIDRHRRAVEDGDPDAAADQAAAGVREHVRAECAKLTPPLMDSEIVGVARIGAHRMIKLAFRGPRGLVVVQQQWRPGPDGWNLHGTEVVRVEPAP